MCKKGGPVQLSFDLSIVLLTFPLISHGASDIVLKAETLPVTFRTTSFDAYFHEFQSSPEFSEVIRDEIFCSFSTSTRNT